MNFLARARSASRPLLDNRLTRNLPHGTARPGLGGVLWDKGERYGAAWFYGWLKGYYQKDFVWRDQGYDLWSGFAFLAIGTALNIGMNGNSDLAKHLERFGDAGIASWLNTVGTGKGAQKAAEHGKSALPLPKAGQTKLKGYQVIGHIPPAMGGAYLSADEIQNWSAKR